MKVLVLVLLAAVLVGCGDGRAQLVEKCVSSAVRDGKTETYGRIWCMRAAYGDQQQQR